jgi:hypothetical protein
MLQLLQPITSWLLIAVVLTGQIPALIHKVECVHSCALDQVTADGSNVVATSSASTCCNQSCCKSSRVVVPPEVDVAAVNSDHECDDCTICQSLLSTNGFVRPSDGPLVTELLQTELLASEQLAPELLRFGISQSRAPPSC